MKYNEKIHIHLVGKKSNLPCWQLYYLFIYPISVLLKNSQMKVWWTFCNKNPLSYWVVQVLELCNLVIWNKDGKSKSKRLNVDHFIQTWDYTPMLGWAWHQHICSGHKLNQRDEEPLSWLPFYSLNGCKHWHKLNCSWGKYITPNCMNNSNVKLCEFLVTMWMA